MGWTDDADTEGLFEENFLVALILGALLIGIATILYFVGFSYDPGWFEDQNIISSMGIIFLIIFIPAIAISTLTGHSDLTKWEGLFLVIAVIMIWMGNNFSWQKFLSAWQSDLSFLKVDSSLSQLVMLILIVVGIGMAIAIATGHKVGIGAVVLILSLILVIGIINWWNAGTFSNISATIQEKGIWYLLGKALSDFTAGLARGGAGAAIGIGCLALGIAMVAIPNTSTPIGVILIIIGTGITGTSTYDWWKNLHLFGIICPRVII